MEVVKEGILSEATVREILSDIVVKENIIDPIFDISRGSKKGDGFLSLMTKVIVSGKNKNLSLLIKHAPRSELIRKQAPIKETYKREILFYNKIYPALRAFEENKIPNFPYIPKCYITNSNEFFELLVMEDVRVKGFQLWDRRKDMSNEMIELVLEAYGRFHALGFAMKHQKPEEYAKLTEGVYELFTHDTLPDFFKIFENQLTHARNLFLAKDGEDYYKKMDACLKSMGLFYNMLKDVPKNNTITHGDCWCNNMMFQFKKNPTELCLLDFQIVRVASPVLDLSNFLYTNINTKILTKLDHFLEVYHKSLSSNLELLGTNAVDVYNLESLKEDWKIYAKHGFFIGLVGLKFLRCEDDEVMDLFDMKENQNLDYVFSRKVKNEQEVDKILVLLCKHMVDNNFI